MQNLIRNFVYKSNPGLVPWWMIAGTALSGRSLLIGTFNKSDIAALSQICKSIDCIDYPDFNRDKNNSLYQMSNEYDVIIINTVNCNTAINISHRRSIFKNLFDHTPIIVVLESNPYHIKFFFRRPLSILKSIFFDLRIQNFKHYFSGKEITKYETLADEHGPYESFPVKTYFTNKNSFLKIEKIKYFLLNSRHSRLFYNSQIWTLTSGKKLLVESILEDIQKNKKFRWEGKQVRLLKIFFNSGKIIISMTSRAKKQPEYILILPFDERSLEQRWNEKKAIKKLHAIKEITGLFVEEIITGRVDQMLYFAMKEFSGITVDIQNPKSGVMNNNAFNTIFNLTKIAPDTNPNSRAKTIVKISAEYISLLLQRFPQHHSTIIKMEKSLPQHIDLPLVMFMHGDMKLENFVINPKTSKVIGIIDLELVEFPGLPLIDLYYLITYNHQTINHETFYQVFIKLIANNLTKNENSYIEEYCNHLNIDKNQKKLCLAFYFLHHFAKRIIFTFDHELANKEFLLGCECITKMLEEMSSID